MSLQAGRTAVAYDVRRDSSGQNLLDPMGFMHAVVQACRLKPGAGALFAPVCSSFVYMTLVLFIGQAFSHLFRLWLVGSKPTQELLALTTQMLDPTWRIIGLSK